MFESFALWVGVVASVTGVIAFAWPKGVRRFRYRVTSRIRRRYHWKDVWPKIEDARRKFDLLQTWIPNQATHRNLVRSALKDGVRMRFLLCDQSLIPHRLHCRSGDASKWSQTIRWIRGLAEEFNDVDQEPQLVRAKFYKALPFGPIYRIDDMVYFGQYFADQDSMNGIAFAEKVGSDLGMKIEGSFEKMWETGTHRSGREVLPGGDGIHSLERAEEKRAEAHKQVLRWIKELQYKLEPVDDGVEKLGTTLDQGGLVIIRHATTDLNDANLISGSLDVSINAQGRREAEELSEWFEDTRWDRIIASPARRTVETIHEIFGVKGPTPTPVRRNEFREREMGDLEGLSKKTYQVSLPRYRTVDALSGFYEQPDGGERYADVFARMRPLLKELVADVVAEDQKILVCTHEGPMQIVAMALEGLSPAEASAVVVDNCEVLVYTP